MNATHSVAVNIRAGAVLTAAASSRLYAYIGGSLLTGIRTEEARALGWDRVHLVQDGDMPPHVEVWRSDRAGGDTKTPKSRRTLQLPAPAVDALKTRKAQQAAERLAAGALWQDTGLVFTTTIGTELDAANVRRAFRAVATQAGLQGSWAPASCGIPSCRCCRCTACGSKTSRDWSVTPGPRSRRRSTARSFARC